MSDNRTPCDMDILQPSKFIFSIPRLTTTQFFCQAINIPGLTVNPVVQATPLKDLVVPGNKLEFENLSIEFLVDEKLKSWLAISDWLRGISFPEDNQQYIDLKTQSKYSQQVKYPQYADAELLILDSNNTPTVKIIFKDLFPIHLSGISMDIRLDASHTITSTATFEFKMYDTEII